MNFIYISPNFPNNFYQFCKSLNYNGVNVLGIGDQSYDTLNNELKTSLREYYKVENLNNYDEVYKAVCYFISRYGRIDWLESNNEYWLLQDARLRTDFNINTGIKEDQIDFIKYKSAMKKIYNRYNIKTARYHLVDNYDNCLSFVREVGYPVIVKPDNGVGASNTFKITCDDELRGLFYEPLDEPYIMEEFVKGELVSYDGIANSKRDVIFESAHYYPVQVMDIVNEKRDCYYWSYCEIPNNLKEIGQKVVKVFPTNSRCFHLEFFILTEDKLGLGQKGDIVALEVNMRTPGGVIPDMINYEADINMYQIYADMVCYDENRMGGNYKKYYSVYASRRKEYYYSEPIENILEDYKNNIITSGYNSEAIAGAMGDHYVIARFKDDKDIWPFVSRIVEES